MPIRIEHQPSAFAVGMAGYAAGQGKARQRQGKYFLDIMQDNQRLQNQQGLLDKRQNWIDQRDAKKDWETTPSWSNIPATMPPETRRVLADLEAQSKDARRNFAYDDPNARKADRDARDKHEDIIRRHVPPSEAEAWNRGLIYIDEKTGRASDQQGPGMVPYRGGQRAIGNRDELAAAKQQQAAVEKAQNDAYDKAVSIQEKWDNEFANVADEVMKEGEAKGLENPWTSPETIRGEAVRRMRIRGRDFRPDIPSAPAASPAPGAAAGGGAAMPRFDALPDGTVAPVAPQAGATGSASPGVVAPPTGTPSPALQRWLQQSGGALAPSGMVGPTLRPSGAGAQGGGAVQPQAAARPFETSVTPVVEDWVGGQQLVPQQGPTEDDVYQMLESADGLISEQQRGMPEQQSSEDWQADVRKLAGTSSQPPQAAPQSSSDRMSSLPLEMQQRIRRMWEEGSPATRAAIEQRYGSMQPLDTVYPDQQQLAGTSSQPPQAAPQSSSDRMSSLPLEMQQRIRRMWEEGSPATRAAIEQRYGSMQPLDTVYPDQQQPVAAPPSTIARQNVEAMRGPQGTGEGIPSDDARVAGQVQGADSLAGREAARRRGELGPGEARTTKYGMESMKAKGDRLAQAMQDSEREDTTNEWYEYAVEERERKKAAGQGAYSPATTASVSKGTMKQYQEIMGQQRKDEMQRRKANLQASKIRITTEAEYDRLRPGTYFTGPDGKVRRKP
jgi:hypothetical protein